MLERKKKVKLSDKAKRGIRIAYNVLVSVMLAVSGVLFAYECYLIYKSGPNPFTRESIAEAFSHVSVLTYITISLVIIGAGLHIFMPKEEDIPRLHPRTNRAFYSCFANPAFRNTAWKRFPETSDFPTRTP